MKKALKRKCVNLKLILVVFLMGYSISTIAQTPGISGRVTDDKGEALLGVTVLVKGTTTATVTDIEGNFVIRKEPANNVILVFSYLGFGKKEKRIKTHI